MLSLSAGASTFAFLRPVSSFKVLVRKCIPMLRNIM